jgi:hypothetical protein
LSFAIIASENYPAPANSSRKSVPLHPLKNKSPADNRHAALPCAGLAGKKNPGGNPPGLFNQQSTQLSISADEAHLVHLVVLYRGKRQPNLIRLRG